MAEITGTTKMTSWQSVCEWCSRCDAPGEDCSAPLEKNMKKWLMVADGLIVCPWFMPFVGERVGRQVYMVNSDNAPASSRNPVIVNELRKLGYRECSFGEWRSAEITRRTR